jgi:demethylmenaquinone methyltransferase/2-methoxy-6-polyprenyl-1,4-benzoquinol methylase
MYTLDVAVGTGLVAREIQRVVGVDGKLVGIDPSAGMMNIISQSDAISLVQGRAEDLPFADASFDFLTLGFALRHLDDLERVFAEFRRVLRPGGRALLLEITRPSGRVAQALARVYMRQVVPLLARAIAQDRETPRLYRYYWDTIEACAAPESIMATLRAAGFSDVDRHVEIGLFSEFRAIV